LNQNQEQQQHNVMRRKQPSMGLMAVSLKTYRSNQNIAASAIISRGGCGGADQVDCADQRNQQPQALMPNIFVSDDIDSKEQQKMIIYENCCVPTPSELDSSSVKLDLDYRKLKAVECIKTTDNHQAWHSEMNLSRLALSPATCEIIRSLKRRNNQQSAAIPRLLARTESSSSHVNKNQLPFLDEARQSKKSLLGQKFAIPNNFGGSNPKINNF
jgi:hypothetical protein